MDEPLDNINKNAEAAYQEAKKIIDEQEGVLVRSITIAFVFIAASFFGSNEFKMLILFSQLVNLGVLFFKTNSQSMRIQRLMGYMDGISMSTKQFGQLMRNMNDEVSKKETK